MNSKSSYASNNFRTEMSNVLIRPIGDIVLVSVIIISILGVIIIS